MASPHCQLQPKVYWVWKGKPESSQLLVATLKGNPGGRAGEDLVTVLGQPLYSQHFLWIFCSCKPILHCLTYIVLGVLLCIAQALYLYQPCWLFLVGLEPQRIILMEMSTKHIWPSRRMPWPWMQQSFDLSAAGLSVFDRLVVRLMTSASLSLSHNSIFLFKVLF